MPFQIHNYVLLLSISVKYIPWYFESLLYHFDHEYKTFNGTLKIEFILHPNWWQTLRDIFLVFRFWVIQFTKRQTILSIVCIGRKFDHYTWCDSFVLLQNGNSNINICQCLEKIIFSWGLENFTTPALHRKTLPTQ